MRNKIVTTLASILVEADMRTLSPQMNLKVYRGVSLEEYKDLIRRGKSFFKVVNNRRWFEISFTDLRETAESWSRRHYNESGKKQCDLKYESYNIDNIVVDKVLLGVENDYRRLFGGLCTYLLEIANLCGVDDMPVRKNSELGVSYIDFNMRGNMISMCIKDMAYV